MNKYSKSFEANQIFGYFFIRYRIFNIFKKKFNKFLVSHEKLISENMKKVHFLHDLNVINWSIDPKKIDLNKKKYLVNFSGALTVYRAEILQKIKINQEIFKKDINVEKIGVFLISKTNKNHLVFSLHPKKTKNWNFSSPTRYINSIRKGEIPIIFDDFKDSHSVLGLKSDILVLRSKQKIADELSLYKEQLIKLHNNTKKKLNFII